MAARKTLNNLKNNSIQMAKNPKKRAAKVFVAVLLCFAVIITYLLFFNQGLELEHDYNIDTKIIVITVKNNSIHTIREINISYTTMDGQTKEVAKIEKLESRETKNIEIQKENWMKGFIDVTADALFHQPATKRVIVNEAETQASLSYSITAPEYAFIGFEYPLKIKICNSESKNPINLELSEEHSEEFFEQENTTQKTSIEPGKCSELTYEFIPNKIGETEIYFNIEAGSYSKSFSQRLSVEE